MYQTITFNGRKFIPKPPLVGEEWKSLDCWRLMPADGHGVSDEEWQGVRDALPSWVKANCITGEYLPELTKPVYAVFGGHIKRINGGSIQYAVGTVIDDMPDGYVNCISNTLIRNITGNSKVGKCRRSSAVYRLTDNAVIVDAGDLTQITFVAGKSHVGELGGQGKVMRILHDATIGNLTGKARVDDMCDDSRIDIVSGKAVVGSMRNRAEILLLSDKAKVLKMDNHAVVRKAWDESQIGLMAGQSQLLYATSLVVVKKMKDAAKVYFDGKPFYYGKMPKVEGNAKVFYYTATEANE